MAEVWFATWRNQVITPTNVDLSSIGPPGKNLNELFFEFSNMETRLKMPHEKYEATFVQAPLS